MSTFTDYPDCFSIAGKVDLNILKSHASGSSDLAFSMKICILGIRERSRCSTDLNAEFYF